MSLSIVNVTLNILILQLQYLYLYYICDCYIYECALLWLERDCQTMRVTLVYYRSFNDLFSWLCNINWLLSGGFLLGKSSEGRSRMPSTKSRKWKIRLLPKPRIHGRISCTDQKSTYKTQPVFWNHKNQGLVTELDISQIWQSLCSSNLENPHRHGSSVSQL